MEHAAALIERYHQPGRHSMVRLVLAPLGPYADTETIYREMRTLADEHAGVTLHTHLHEVADMAFCLEKYGLRPLDLMERAGWVGDRVLFYHMSDPAPTAADVAQAFLYLATAEATTGCVITVDGGNAAAFPR